MIGDLTTLANVQAWLNAGTTAPFPPDADAMLTRLITACSGFVQNYLSRNIVPAVHSEKYNGTGQDVLWLTNRPIINVTAVSINGTSIIAAPDTLSSGFVFDDTRVYLRGWIFSRGHQNISIDYVSGFQSVTTQNIAAILSTEGFPLPWNADMGVSVGGVPFTAITSGSPAQGQYKVDINNKGYPQYTFNVADAGSSAAITFGYTPFDLEQVVIEAVAEAFKRRNRIGQSSVNMGDGQVVNFSLVNFNSANKSLLNQYMNVVH